MTKKVKLINYKKDFPWFQFNKNLVYFDNAATTLKPKQMIEAVRNFYEKYSYLPDNESFKLSSEIKKKVNETRTNLAKLLSANKKEVFFTSGSTESLNLISDAFENFLHEGDEIVVHYIEHGSNLLPWYRLRDRLKVKIVLVGKDSSDINVEMFKNAITPKTKVVAFTSASNLLANWVDAKSIVQAVKEINNEIYCVIDATQQLEHFPALCHETGCDFLVGSAHKLIGPTGLGFIYIKQEIQNKISWMPEDKDLHKAFVNKYELKTLNIGGIIAFNESIKILLKISYKKMMEREHLLKKYFLENVDMSKIKLYTPSIDSPLITFNIYDKNGKFIDGQDIEFYLGQKGILSRSTLSCAKLARYPLDTRSVVRVSLFFYNDLNDIKKLVEAINAFSFGDELNGLI